MEETVKKSGSKLELEIPDTATRKSTYSLLKQIERRCCLLIRQLWKSRSSSFPSDDTRAVSTVGVRMSSGIVDMEFSVIEGKRNEMFSMTYRGSRRRFAECGS
jgi:hypothetical protein